MPVAKITSDINKYSERTFKVRSDASANSQECITATFRVKPLLLFFSSFHLLSVLSSLPTASVRSMWRPAEASAGRHPHTEARPLLLFTTRTTTPPASDLPRHGGLAAISELFGGGRPKITRLDLKEAGPQ
jgi:hypothetical protein